MALRLSQLVVQLVLLDDFDAIKNSDPIVFSGDADSTAVDKLRGWLDELPARLAEAEKAADEQPPAPTPNRAQRRTKKT